MNKLADKLQNRWYVSYAKINLYTSAAATRQQQRGAHYAGTSKYKSCEEVCLYRYVLSCTNSRRPVAFPFFFWFRTRGPQGVREAGPCFTVQT